jgi:hypothetical protein
MGILRRRIVLLTLAAVALSACVSVFFGRRSISQENLDRIVPGMSPSEVQAIFGEPATFVGVRKGLVLDSQTFVTEYDVQVQRNQGHSDYEVRVWTVEGWNYSSSAVVVFDKGQVVSRRFHGHVIPGRWDRIKARLSSLF